MKMIEVSAVPHQWSLIPVPQKQLEKKGLLGFCLASLFGYLLNPVSTQKQNPATATLSLGQFLPTVTAATFHLPHTPALLYSAITDVDPLRLTAHHSNASKQIYKPHA